MKNTFSVLGIIFLFVVFFVITSLASSFMLYFDILSILLVLTFSIVPGIIGFGFRGVKNAFIYGLGDTQNIEKKELITYSNTLKTLFIASLLSGPLGTMIGIVAILGNLDDFSKIAPPTAIACLTTLFGIFFAIIIYLPLWLKLKNASELK